MRCKVGDRAFFIEPDSGLELLDVGKIVRVVEAGCDWSQYGDSRFHWRCEALTGPMYAANPETGDVLLCDWLDIPDSSLSPIPGQGETPVSLIRELTT
jgi:acetamidase/formamidase